MKFLTGAMGGLRSMVSPTARSALTSSTLSVSSERVPWEPKQLYAFRGSWQQVKPIVEAPFSMGEDATALWMEIHDLAWMRDIPAGFPEREVITRSRLIRTNPTIDGASSDSLALHGVMVFPVPLSDVKLMGQLLRQEIQKHEQLAGVDTASFPGHEWPVLHDPPLFPGAPDQPCEIVLVETEWDRSKWALHVAPQAVTVTQRSPVNLKEHSAVPLRSYLGVAVSFVFLMENVHNVVAAHLAFIPGENRQRLVIGSGRFWDGPMPEPAHIISALEILQGDLQSRAPVFQGEAGQSRFARLFFGGNRHHALAYVNDQMVLDRLSDTEGKALGWNR